MQFFKQCGVSNQGTKRLFSHVISSSNDRFHVRFGRRPAEKPESAIFPFSTEPFWSQWKEC